MEQLVKQLLEGDRRALARLLSIVEEQSPKAFDALELLWGKSQQAPSVGITGPAGAGKSTLVDASIKHLRDQNKKVGVVAVDPTSPFTGGAVLGDRIRMQRHSGDENVYIRSMGSRGKTGGISFATRAFIHILSAFGLEELMVETVGAGQSETSVVEVVDTTVVVLVPEAGDAIQALKAGMLEIADVYVVNKKDRDGADQVVFDIESMLSMGSNKSAWQPKIIQTQATNGEGVDELWTAIEEHRVFLQQEQKSEQEILRSRKRELRELLEMLLLYRTQNILDNDKSLKEKLIQPKAPNLYMLASDLIKNI
ncbi:MAG TPA: methylmalonyl Co-A mutase-associated GTPase MeaB [Oligoflexia bacterium]|nr:methylmalonyl Co-A mutase-associated GTPase MeaB [Oligoflexia bacterium]HMR24598.1 methylmalonyl Co-A mutase-associated GTPase MeaB [Oligoflexia bacterium]